MARFIPIDKMKSLREAAKSGNANAIKILDMQMSGDDFGSLMDEFFQPKSEQNVQVEVGTSTSTQSLPKKTKLEEFLDFNGVTKDSPDYDSFVEDFYREFPNERNAEMHVEEPKEEVEEQYADWIKKLIAEESDAIDSYSKAITKVMNCEMLEDNQKRRAIARLKEIRGDEEEHFRELTELLKNNDEEKPVEEALW